MNPLVAPTRCNTSQVPYGNVRTAELCLRATLHSHRSPNDCSHIHPSLWQPHGATARDTTESPKSPPPDSLL